MQILISLMIALLSVVVFAQSNSGQTKIQVKDVEKKQKTKAEANYVEPTAAQQNAELRMIEVTGSYIRRVDEQGPSPVVQMTSKEIQQTGQNSIADVFRESAFTNQGSREDSLSGNPGASTAGIGVFGSARVLTLLDGQRLPKMGGSNSVDLNLIPLSAIERVDIQRDGASATYGSDAIGGVMNFITKKNFTGGTLSIRQTSPEQGGGSRGDASVSFGRTYKKGSFLVAVERKDNSHLADQDRDFSRMIDIGGQGSRSGNYGTLRDLNTGKSTYNPNCPAANVDSNTGNPQDGTCRYDYSTDSWTLPDIQQTSALISGSWKLNRHLKSRTTVNLVNREVQTQLAPAPDSVSLTTAEANALFGAQGFNATGAAPVILDYRIADEGGPRRGFDETNMFNIGQRLSGQIAGSWTWDLSGNFGKSIRRNTGTGYANKAIVTDLIKTGAYRPWAPQGQKGSLAGALISTHDGQRSEQSGLKLVTSGTLYNGGDNFGPVAVALGGSVNWQRYSQDVDSVTAAGNNWGGIGGNGEGSRAFQGLFAEISAFPTDEVEIGLAARMDHYSDQGTAFTPKISMSWTPNEKFMLRSSLGTGYRVPNLSDLYGGQLTSFPTFTDGVGAANGVPGANTAQQYQQNTFANANLTEEESQFFNIGTVFQPAKNWSIETNYVYAKIKNGVGNISNTFLMRRENELRESGMSDAAVAAYFNDNFQTTINRDASLGLISLSRPAAFNLSRSRISGIDFTISNSSNIQLFGRGFKLLANMEHFQTLKPNQRAFLV